MFVDPKSTAAPKERVNPEPPESNREPSVAKELYLPIKNKSKSLATYDLRLLAVGAGIVLVLLLLAFGAIRHPPATATARSNKARKDSSPTSVIASRAEPSIIPIMEAGRPREKESDGRLLAPEQIAATQNRQGTHRTLPAKLGEVPPFDNARSWQAPPYQPPVPASGSVSEVAPMREAASQIEHDSLDKPSLVFVRNNPSSPPSVLLSSDSGIRLSPGTRLRARLESAVTTAVETPIVAVVEYNYEQNGEVLVPAGAKAFGRLEAADRSGYLGIRFDSMVFPEGVSVALQAAATDLKLRPLQGRVEGKNTGKSILVRSLDGVGEVAAALVGRGSLNQPLSEDDLMRERLGNNLGQAGDQELRKLAMSEHVVVTLPADTEIYIVFEKAAKENLQNKPAEAPTSLRSKSDLNRLRQLLELERELNESSMANSPAQ